MLDCEAKQVWDQSSSETFFCDLASGRTVDVDDWSLPDWVRPERYSGISINEKKLPADFPGRIQRTVRVSWREIESRPGKCDFSMLHQRTLLASEDGKYAIKMRP